MVGSPAVDALGLTLGLDMADWWQADSALFDLIRDKEVLGAMVAEVAGQAVADANAREKGATLKKIVTDHLAGIGGRPKVARWVPKWLAFPPAAYTARGGVGVVAAHARVAFTMAARGVADGGRAASKADRVVPEAETRDAVGPAEAVPPSRIDDVVRAPDPIARGDGESGTPAPRAA